MKNLVKLMMVALLLTLILVSCSKLNRENYDQIKVGMGYQQVIELIGQPDTCDAAIGMKKCVWGNEKKNVTINFVADKVAVPTMKGL